MRFFILVALCLAAASASYTNRNRFNRLLRNLQQQQQGQEYGCGPQCQLAQLYGDNDQDDEFENQQQCRRGQNCGSWDLNDDETEYDSDEQDEEQNQYQQQYQGQGRQHRRQQQQWQQDEEQIQPQYQGQGRQQGQQQKRQQQQRHQCQPQYQLLQDLEQPNCQLASNLYKQAKQENDDKNTVVSPTALQLALAAIQRGARGQTKRQIQRIIGGGLSTQQNRKAHTALQQSLQGQDPIQRQNGQPQRAQIKTTTTIVINQRNRAQQQFIQAVRACLNVQVKKCNFQQQPQQCRQQINRLVAQKTHHKLQHVVPQDAVTENTKMIVVNTAQVKAPWGRQFRQQQQTKQGRFYPLGCQQPKHVQVMQAQGQFNYYEDEQLQIVGIPTQQQEMTLYVMVPKNKDGLNQVEKAKIQDGQQLKELLQQAEQQQQQVEIELPKFQIKHKLDAKQTLRKKGIQQVFDADEADLSGINGQQPQEQQQQHRRRQQQQYGQDDEEQYQNQYQQDGEQRQQQLHVNKLIHQATIKVDEQGIHAARPQQGQQQQQQYNQYQQDDEQDDEQDGQEDEQEQQYLQQQYERQEMLEQVFGQRQRRQQQQQQQRRRQQQQRLRRQQQQHQQYQDQDQDQDEYQQGQYNQGEVQVKANRAFAFALKHNPSNQIVMVGRVVDATQKPKNNNQGLRQQQQGQQSLNGVDQQ